MSFANQAMARFAQLQNDEEDVAVLWHGKTQAFRNLYSFLNQVIPCQDSDLEKLFTCLRHLALKLPKRKTDPGYQFDEELFTDYMSKPELQEVVSKWMGSQVYDWLGGSKDSIVYPKT